MASRHVLLARGRDYADVRPLSGVYSGQKAELFGVTVETPGSADPSGAAAAAAHD